MEKNNSAAGGSKLISDIKNLGNIEIFGPEKITKKNIFEDYPLFVQLADGLEKIHSEPALAKQRIKSSINNIRGYLQSFDTAKQDVYGNALISNELSHGSALVFETADMTAGSEFYEPLGLIVKALNAAAAYVTMVSLSLENPNRTHLSYAGYDLQHEISELMFRARDMLEDNPDPIPIRS